MDRHHLQAARCSAGDGCLRLAIGKTAGKIAAWRSPRFSNLSGLEGKANCGTLCSAQSGSATVVGLAWALPPTRGQDPIAVLTAAGQDGCLSSWRWEGREVCARSELMQG